LTLAIASALQAAQLIAGQPAAAQKDSGPQSVDIRVNAVVLAEPGTETPLAIEVGPASAVPPRSFVRIRGLPTSVSLSEGYAIAPGAWAVPLAGLPSLRVRTPAGVATRAEVSIMLVDVDGNLLRDAKITLVIAAAAVLPARTEPQPAAKPPAPAAPAKPAVPAVPTAPPEGQIARPSQPTYQLAEAMRMLTKGDDLLAAGNVALARLFYQRAAEMGLGSGALALASTFDASELQRRGIAGVQPDAEQARQWYERAKDLGAPEAAERLSNLGAR
jgi:hypothetical protein